MITNEDRRRVATRLRELGKRVYSPENTYELMAYTLGVDDFDGTDEMFARLADLIEPEKITGDTSDGYHTFDELYDHRAKLFSVIVRDHREIAWKSRLHHDGTMYDGMFIVGVETPEGQATYHYDVDPYWDLSHSGARPSS